ncbi:MAG TPA: 50S ribosomal protein L4 [Candidatus Angelobacter sp.]|jgi:large subunit ribosomal protein L4|nr:50S ribosomal protein L4 [Candidatus Angelobacter sp.]
MATANVVDQKGAVTGSLDLAPEVFEITPNEAVMHQALVRQLANGRQGTHSTKNRSEVRGGGRKPYRQKGTGRARQGSIRSPQFEGGGVVFGPTPRSYAQDMPRKQRRLALRSALSAKAAAGELTVLESFELEAPRTKAVTELLESLKAGKRVLLVLGSHNEMLERSARNVPYIQVILASNLNVRDLLVAETVLITRDAVEHTVEVLS